MDCDARMKRMFEDTDVIFYSEELDDDGYEGVEEDDRDGLFYEYEYGNLIDQVEDLLKSENYFNETGSYD